MFVYMRWAGRPKSTLLGGKLVYLMVCMNTTTVGPPRVLVYQVHRAHWANGIYGDAAKMGRTGTDVANPAESMMMMMMAYELDTRFISTLPDSVSPPR